MRFPNRRQFLALAGAGTAAASSGGVRRARAATKELYIGSYSDIQDVVKKVWVAPFEEKYGVKVYVSAGASMDQLAKMRAEQGRPRHSVMMMDDAVINVARRFDLVAPLPKASMPSLAEVYPELIVEGGYGVAIAIHNAGVAYHKPGKAPASWRDLWGAGLERQVLIPSIKLTNGIMMLVMASSLKTGKPVREAQYDIGPGFEEIARLKPNLLNMFTQTTGAINLLIQGEVKFAAPFFSKNVYRFVRDGAPIDMVLPKEGGFIGVNAACLVKGAPEPELAAQFLDFGLSAPVQQAFAREAVAGPVNSKADLPEDLRKKVPFGAEALKRLHFLDWGYINDHRDEWTERWNKEIAA